MDSVLGSIRAEGRLDRINQAVRVFEEARQQGGSPGLEGLWRGAEGPEQENVAVLAALVKSDLRHRFNQGESPAVAEYIDRFPELRGSNSRILSLIYEEFCLREEGDEPVGVESFCDRYPDWKDSLASQLQYHQMISQAAGLGSAAPKFPKPGDYFGEFELLSMLGTGGSSRVFLARDTSLGDRVVVLKVAIDRGNEPMILGRLVHPHIVWVNSVSYQPETLLRGLSMPYHPGLPLDEIIKGFNASIIPRHARFFWDVLITNRANNPPESPAVEGSSTGLGAARRSLKREEPSGDGWKGFPIRGSYPQGVAWIGRVLAEALHHAHGKRTFHRDIKPGNVLMTLSQGPQLLDFNLAESPHSAERADDALHGGTLPYMAPEQIRAFLDPTRWEQVGASADIYSLGLVLRELLTGRLPDFPDDRLPRTRALADFLDRRELLDPAIRRFNPSVPYALEAIVARCLAIDPHDRYANASDLAEDLQRFLELRPLRYAHNQGRRERLENWLVRRRRLVELAVACSLGTATLLNPLPIERSPIFTKTIQNITKQPNQAGGPSLELGKDSSKNLQGNERGLLDESIAPLTDLALAYPDSPLPHFFLCLALDASDRGDHRPAEESFRKAMAFLDAESVIVDWARRHPEVGLIDSIDHFSELCLKVNTVINDAIAAKIPLPKGRTAEDREPLNALARQAAELALVIDPGHGRSLYASASNMEGQKHFDVAYHLISRLLASFNLQSPLEDREMRFAQFLTRGRIATSWAEEKLRFEGGPPDLRGAASLLTHAISDLDRGDHLVVSAKDRVFVSLYIRTIAALTLAEVNLEFHQAEEARQLIAHAEEAFGKLSRMNFEIRNQQKIQARLAEASRRFKASAQAREGLPIGRQAQAPDGHVGTIAGTHPEPN